MVGRQLPRFVTRCMDCACCAGSLHIKIDDTLQSVGMLNTLCLDRNHTRLFGKDAHFDCFDVAHHAALPQRPQMVRHSFIHGVADLVCVSGPSMPLSALTLVGLRCKLVADFVAPFGHVMVLRNKRAFWQRLQGKSELLGLGLAAVGFPVRWTTR